MYSEYIMCLACSKSCSPTLAIVKIGSFQSTSNLWVHKKSHYSEEYDAIAKPVNLKNSQSTTRGEVVPTSIRNMPRFVTKLNAKCAKLVYRSAAATFAIEEGIPFRTFKQPLFLRSFTSLNHESGKFASFNVIRSKMQWLRWVTILWRQQRGMSTTTTLLGQLTTGWVQTKQHIQLSLRTGLMRKLGVWGLQFWISRFLKGQPPVRESMKISWQFFRNIRVKLKTQLCLTQLASRIRQEILESWEISYTIMVKNIGTVLTTICI